MTELSRRDFLNLAARGFLAITGVVGLAMLGRYLGHQTEPPPPTEFDLGPASSFPIGIRTLVAEVPALLIRNETGFTALSLTCSHLGCTVEQQADGFACPCHGSHFDAEGKPVRGPASKVLAALRVEVNEQNRVILHLD